jgi:hypothetical protein
MSYRMSIGVMATCTLALTFICVHAPADHDDPKVATNSAISALRSSIEKRFGKPDVVKGSDPTFLEYQLDNGDTLIFAVSSSELVRVTHHINLKALVGQRVKLTGTFTIGKIADFIRLEDGQCIYLRDPQGKVTDRDYEQRIEASGILRHSSGIRNSAPPGAAPGAPVPAHYYLEAPILRVVKTAPDK